MNYKEITDLVFQYVARYNEQNDFQTASSEMKDIIYNLSKDEFIPLINQIGIIPEKISHDSKEEKLYSKVSEIFLGKCFEELGFNTSLFVTRADTADILARSKYHGYTLVSDAKAFRLSRTAKNQKDFKVESMDVWRGDNDYSVLCCPYYQYPKKTSAIFKQSLDKKVSLLSWEHFSFFIKNNIKETIDTDLSIIWKFPSKQGEITTVKNMENNYFDEQNIYITNKTNISHKLLIEYLDCSKKKTIERCENEKNFGNSKKKKSINTQRIKR